MMDDRPGTEPWIFFSQERGGSWKNWDNVLFLWIGDHLVLLALCVCGLIGLVWWAGMRCLRGRSVRRHIKGCVLPVDGQKKDDDV
jgi:inositol phosphorylceramide mannosyltransferase catalytic subunit